MDQIANGSPQHLLYALQQPQSEVTFLHHHNNNNNSNDNSNNNKMDMSIVDRQRLRLQQQNWRSSAQMNGPFVSEIFSDAVMATEWHQFAAQNGHLLTANRQDTPMFSCSMSSPPFPLKNQLSLQNDWPNLSNNVDMVKSGGDGNSAVTETTCLGTFPSDPGFAERAAKFSSFNGNNASGGGSMVTYQKTASVEETAQNTSESVTNVAGNEQRAACSNDSEGSKRICGTVSCPSSVDKTTRDAEKLTTAAEGCVISEKLSPGETKVLSDYPTRKRKNERTRSQDSQAADSDEFKEKRTKSLDKVKEDKKSKTEQSNSDNSVESTPKAVKENSKPSENQQKDYIHVRARRGQATDSHSLAERVRREKISERMKYLQDLVPGCNKVTGKAVMLDEIINYVQSLQRQVEFLSMKLAAVNPKLDLNIDNIFAKEMLPPCGNFSLMGGVSTDLGHYLQFQQMQQQQAALQGVCCGLDMPTVVSSVDATSLHRTPISAEMFVDNNFQGHAPSPWDNELQNVFSTGLVEGREPPFVSQGISGHMEVNHMKMEL